MYNGLLHAHSGLRWVVLILLLAAIFNAFSKKKSGTWGAGDKKLALFSNRLCLLKRPLKEKLM